LPIVDPADEKTGIADVVTESNRPAVGDAITQPATLDTAKKNPFIPGMCLLEGTNISKAAHNASIRDFRRTVYSS